jgi:hypothetical protein
MLGGLAPGLPQESTGEPAPSRVALAVVAPARAELRRSWLEQAVATAAGGLERDGVVWIVVPRRWRGVAERSLGRSGLTLLQTVLTLPAWPAVEHLIPLSTPTLRHAGRRELGWSSARSAVLGRAVALPPLRRLARRTVPACALVAGHAGTPLLRWLGELDGGGVAAATVRVGRRRDAPMLVAQRYPPGAGSPDLVAKIALDEAAEDRLERERLALRELGPVASRAGAVVPVPSPGRASWLLATGVLPGRSAAALLAESPAELEPLGLAVARWVAAWNAATARRAHATAALLDELLVRPAERLEDLGAVPRAYVAAVAALARRLEGGELVRVCAHNDLTMSNVLTQAGGLAVLDWEAATETGLPMHDLWYALADAVARARRVSHAHAVELLVRGSSHAATTALAAAPGSLAAALSLTQDQALLGFHASWLAHAMDELDRAADGPFTAVVRAVAARGLLTPADPPA